MRSYLPAKRRGISSRLEDMIFKYSGRAALGAGLCFLLALLSHYRH